MLLNQSIFFSYLCFAITEIEVNFEPVGIDVLKQTREFTKICKHHTKELASLKKRHQKEKILTQKAHCANNTAQSTEASNRKSFKKKG